MQNKINCEFCNQEYSKSSWKGHIKTKKHLENEQVAKLKSAQQVAEVINEQIESIKFVNEQMESTQIINEQIESAEIVNDFDDECVEIVADFDDADNEFAVEYIAEEPVEEDVKITIPNAHFEMVEIEEELTEQSDNICHQCHSELACPKCSIRIQKGEIIGNMQQYKPIQSAELPEGIVDVRMMKKENKLYVSTEKERFLINPENITVKNFSLINKEKNNNYPIHEIVDYDIVTLADYKISKDIAIDYYGHAAHPKQLLQKILHDNNVQFAPLQNYFIAYCDIETYNDVEWDKVPLLSQSSSHIAMISIVIVQFCDNKFAKLSKLCLINMKNEYDLFGVDQDIQLILYPDEQQMCAGFFDILMQLNQQVFIATFNGSTNQFSQIQTDYGYDMPFITNRSRLSLSPIIKHLKVEDDGVDEDGNEIKKYIGKSLTAIDELTNLQFVDYCYVLYKLADQTTKNKLESRSLDSWLKLLNIPAKLEHNYFDLQKRLSQKRSNISDIVNYCVYDSAALWNIEQQKGIISNIIAFQSLMSIPISWAIHNTNVQNLTYQLQQEYINRGYMVQYYVAESEQTKYKGAYTETVAEPNIVYKNVICQDFESLYPNCIIGNNIDLITFRREIDGDCYTVDCSDDPAADQQQYHFRKDITGVISTNSLKKFEMRKQMKMLMKSDPINYKKYDALQYSIKIAINSMYGLCAYSRNPLFFKPLAICVTAFARKSTMTTVEIVKENGHKFLASDTDSVFYQLRDDVMTPHDVAVECHLINKEVQKRMGTTRLNLIYEEIFTHIAFMDGRKSYYALYLEQHMNEWHRDYVDDNNWCKDKIRGVSWSKMSTFMQNTLQNDIRQYLQSDYSAIDFYQQAKEYHIAQIKKAIDEHDLDTIRKYAEKIKITNSKDLTVKALRRYEQFFESDTMIDIVAIQGKCKLTDRKIPVSALNEMLIKRIDVDQMMKKAMGMHVKLFLNKSQKKTAYKDKMELNIDSANLDDIVCRIEKKKYNRITFDTQRIYYDQIHQYIKENVKQSVHEIITQNNIRLTFDVDGQIDEVKFYQDMEEIVQQCLGGRYEYTVLRSTGKKCSLHIYYKVAVSLQFASKIAGLIKVKWPQVDTLIYCKGKSLRLANCIKFDMKNAEVINRIFPCKKEDMLDCLLTYTGNIPFVSMPIHLYDTQMIDGFYSNKIYAKSAENTQTGQIVTEYLTQNNIPAVIDQQQNGLYRITPSDCYICPIHKRQHDRIGLFVTSNETRIQLYCFATESKEQRKTETIVLWQQEKEQSKKDDKVAKKNKQQLKIHRLIETCNNQINLLQNAIQSESKYLECNIGDELKKCDVLYIRSQLGTGKSHLMSKYLEQTDSKVVILSHRITFSQDIKSRYGGVLYSDVSGQLCMEKYPRVICQIDSINRLSAFNDCVLVLDEIESLLTQLNGGVARQNNAIDGFIQLLQQAGKIIVMDGFLQDQTVNLIQHIIGNRTYNIIQNLYRPYAGHQIILRDFMIQNDSKKEDCVTAILQELYDKVDYDTDQKRNITEGRNDKKIVVFCTSNTFAKKIQECCALASGYELKIRIYHGGDLEQNIDGVTHYEKKVNDLSNVTENWQCDLLIYTSTITAGVNFDMQYFSKFIHIYVSQTCDAMSFIQGMVRVRQFKEKSHVIYFQTEQHEFEELDFQSPYQQILQSDISLFNRNLSYQLDLFLRCRKAAVQKYRNSIVAQSLYELGFQLISGEEMEQKYGVTIRNLNGDKPDKFDYVMCDVKQSDIQLYNEIQLNKNILLEMQIPYGFDKIYKKITACNIIGVNPLDVNGSEYLQKAIGEDLKQHQQYRQVKHLLSRNIQFIEAIIEQDRIRQQNYSVKSKDVNRVMLKKQRMLLEKGLELKAHMSKNNIIYSRNIDGLGYKKSQIITYMNAVGYTVEIECKRTKTERYKLYHCKPITI